MLVGPNRVGEVLRILTCEVWKRGAYADALLAVAPGTGSSSGLSGLRIADWRSLCPRGGLPRVVKGNLIEFCLPHTRQKCAHKFVLALTADVSLHCREETLRILPGEAWYSGPLADPAIAVTRGATDGLQVRRSRPMAIFALQLALRGQPTHERVAESVGLAGVAA